MARGRRRRRDRLRVARGRRCGGFLARAVQRVGCEVVAAIPGGTDGTHGENLIFSGQYRLYGYTRTIHHAWFGYRWDDGNQVELGVTQVPFGLLPFATHSFWFGLGYYVGVEDDYERLEFLGDAILGAVAASWLYDTRPDLDEGELSKLKSYVVSEPVLAQHAEHLGQRHRVVEQSDPVGGYAQGAEESRVRRDGRHGRGERASADWMAMKCCVAPMAASPLMNRPISCLF